jgi:hypothetical protein
LVGVPNIGENDLALLVFPVKGEMVMKMKAFLLSGALCAMAWFAGSASANTLTAGQSGITPDTFSPITGTVVVSVNNVAYAEVNAQNATVGLGTYSAWVISGDSSNAWGGLDFIIQVNRTSGDIGRITTSPFDSFLVDAGVTTTLNGVASPGSVIPVNQDRNTSNVIGFNFDPTILSGGTEYLVIKTNANGWQPGSISIIDSGTANVVGFAPVAGPAPASLWGGAGLLGLMGIFAMRRRMQMA